MVVTQKGSRLSIQPVTEKEFHIIKKIGSSESLDPISLWIVIFFFAITSPYGFEEKT